MKKIIAMFMCLCMVLSAVPVFAEDVAVADTKVCKVLLDENFEGETVTNFKMEETSGATGAVNEVAETDKYGFGTKNYSITNANTSPYGKIVFDETKPMTESLRAGSQEKPGYTVEISMDWNPFDYNTTNASNTLAIRGREMKDTDFKIGQFMYLKYVGGDAATSGRTLSISDRVESNVLETFDLTEVIGDEARDTEHIYRVRFVIKPYDEVRIVETTADDGSVTTTKYSGTIDIYVDGIKLTTIEYKDDTRETYVYGLFYKTNKAHASYIDNVKMVSYWDELNAETEGAVEYINDDELVTKIRNCEADLSKLDAGKQAILTEAITSAKAAFESAEKTQASVDAALKALKDAETEVNKVYKYKTLYSENFEGAEYNGFNASSDEETNLGGISDVDNSCYGVGNNWYSLQASGKSGVIQQFTKPSGMLRNNSTNIENNYKAELSFDYKMPETILSYILIHGTSNGGEFQTGRTLCQLQMNPEKETAVLKNRSGTNIAEFNLADYTKGASFKETVNRFRFVFEPETMEEIDGVKYAGTLVVYINGIKACDAKYVDNKYETYIGGISVRSASSNVGAHLGYIDNIEMIEYDDVTCAVENSVAYVNGDKLISEIRKCEAKLSGLSEEKQSILSSAISLAKAAFESKERTQESVDAVAEALKTTELELADKVYKYKTLYSEDFEGAEYNGFVPYYEDDSNLSVVADSDNNGVNYGTDCKWYSLQTNNRGNLVQQFPVTSGIIRGNSANIANNYKAELSFDYKMPEDISSYILVNTSYKDGEFVKGGKIFQLNMDPQKGTGILYNRDSNIVAKFNLADYAKGVSFEETVNRFRFVFEPETIEEIDGVKYAGTLNLYINGIKVCNTKYVSHDKEAAIAGLSIRSGSSVAGSHLGYIDNIEMIEYDDVTSNVENSIAYPNCDNLVAAIRGAESIKVAAVAEGIAIPENLDALIAEAEAVCEDAKATTETMNVKAEELNNSVSNIKNALYSYSLIKDFAWIPDVAAANEKAKAQNSIYEDMYLPSNYMAGTRDLDITWESENPGVIDSAGYVSGALVNTYVNLKAIFTDGTDNNIYAEKVFKTRVLAGGKVIFNQIVETADTTPLKNIIPTNKKFMLTVSGKAGEYTFKTGGQVITYTFANDGDYDIIYDIEKNTYTIYENCVEVSNGSVTLGAVKNAIVTGKEITQFIGVDLNTEEAFISDYSYNDGTYDLGVPTPGSALTGITLKARTNLQNLKLVAASYSADGKLLDLASEDINAVEGAIVSVTFEDPVSLPDADGYNGAALKIFLWNAQLTPVMTPVIYSDLGAQYDDRATIYMIGDSTMCNYSASYYPRAGWGQMLGNYFDAEEVVVDNRAVSGRTTRWFKDKGEFDKILKVIKPGDYLIMQFGHNDQKEANNISLDEYKEYLKYFADSVQAKGAVPVICSSISRRYYNAETGLYDPTIGSLGEYPAAAMAVANELGITGLDLYGYSKTVLENLTEEASRQLYCFVPNDYPGFDETKLVKYVDGAQDNTHFSEYGAGIWAKEAARLISLTDLAIASCVTITE